MKNNAIYVKKSSVQTKKSKDYKNKCKVRDH